MQNSVGWNWEEKQECWEDWTCTQWVGELKQGSIPTRGAESEEKHLGLRVKHLIFGSLNEIRI